MNAHLVKLLIYAVEFIMMMMLSIMNHISPSWMKVTAGNLHNIIFYRVLLLKTRSLDFVDESELLGNQKCAVP